MPLSPSDLTRLKARMSKNGGRLTKAAEELGLDFEECFRAVGKERVYGRNPRPELLKYVISQQKPGGAWTNTDQVDLARKDYDRGFVELCQWRDGPIVFLLRIPRKSRDVNRRPYFSYQPLESF